jgi:2-oxoglutarate dehydrogenase E2 component (dihydrolipoamide succinyltransferase)
MTIELRVPEVGESITEVQIGTWLKKEGDRIERDEALVEIESDKATLELPAPVSGLLSKVLKKQGEMAKVGDLIAEIGEGDGAKAPAVGGGKAEQPAAKATSGAPAQGPAPRVMPSAQRLMAEHQLAPSDVAPSGPGGRILKEDVLQRLARSPATSTPSSAPAAAAPAAPPRAVPARPAPTVVPADGGPRVEEPVPMSPMRIRIAERLKEAQNTSALLTTFNEIDMAQVVSLREELREPFLERFGVKLGFMSFFVKATIDALMQFPQVNAEIRGKEIVYRNYYDIGIAVGGGKGLVVPVLRGAERMSFAEIEIAISDFAARARENKLSLDELKGGTFTISNGGVYGSLLSTPIINPPQSGILGLHAIEKRPVVVNDQIVIRPMMYVALTYDHRIIDGRESVTFLKQIKELVERPTRMLLGI